MIPLVRAAALSDFDEVAVSVGIDPAACLREVGLDETDLADPDHYLAAELVSRLLENAARRSGREDFGLRLAERRQLSNLGVISLALNQTPTLRAAVDLLIRFIRLHIDCLLLRLDEFDQSASIGVEWDVRLPVPSRTARDLTIGSLYRIVKGQMGPDWRAREIRFRRDRPASLEMYRRVFDGTPIVFGAHLDAVVFATADLDRPAPNADPLLAAYGLRYLESLPAATATSLAEHVRRLILAQMASGNCSIGRVARRLGLDSRTLQRRLAAEGETYSHLVNNVRRTVVLRGIESQRHSVAEIATQAGLSESAALARWFRQEFGCSISEWRRRHRKGAGAPE
jgi:AraC-like DNA-binding protein